MSDDSTRHGGDDENPNEVAAPKGQWSDSDYVAEQGQSFLSRLYSGTGAFNVIGKSKLWYVVSGIILLICIASMIFRGFTFGIEFEGGTEIAVPARSAAVTTDAVTDVYKSTLGESPDQVQKVGSGSAATVQVRTEKLEKADSDRLLAALGDAFSKDGVSRDDVSSSDVSSSWGREITKKMLIALAIFLVVVFIYITIRFDREMSIAALASLIFDLVATAGVYSLIGWEVSPATVIGLLTILGFSVYDTVVVFDKVEENTRSVLVTRRRTYAEQTNLAVNQTLMRSINTTIISVLPIIALMVVAVWMLGIGTLKDLALIQLVGVVVGTYSSIFLAAPVLVSLKVRRKDIAAHTKSVLARRAKVQV